MVKIKIETDNCRMYQKGTKAIENIMSFCPVQWLHQAQTIGGNIEVKNKKVAYRINVSHPEDYKFQGRKQKILTRIFYCLKDINVYKIPIVISVSRPPNNKYCIKNLEKLVSRIVRKALHLVVWPHRVLYPDNEKNNNKSTLCGTETFGWFSPINKLINRVYKKLCLVKI